MNREDWDLFESWTCTKNSIIRNSENIEEGVGNLKKMKIDFETFSCLLQLAFKA